ncbi:MAG TPA: ATP synthase subunit I [Steroidobacteraceae bacterium]|nr:ATP synthase subunit I [Steroidobacteraceae bacterium]
MTEVAVLLPALAFGLMLGALFFGGLWWTVTRGISARHAALWFLVSLLLRTGIAMLGFYLVGRGSWQKLAACLAGFVIARLIVTRLSSDAAPRRQAAGSTSHAP